jgi:GTP-binding protein
MKITKGVFITSVASVNNLIKDKIPQIAFVGRSNVGKSSLLNMLADNKKLAKTSNTPGRTRLINYFLINESFYFVDLPGYGFAKASKSESSAWQSLIEPYLVNYSNLKCVCVLVDIRHIPSDLDQVMINFLFHYNIPFLIIATKCDKLSKSKIKPALNVIANTLKVGVGNIYPTSSEQKLGKEDLLNKFNNMLISNE